MLQCQKQGYSRPVLSMYFITVLFYITLYCVYFINAIVKCASDALSLNAPKVNSGPCLHVMCWPIKSTQTSILFVNLSMDIVYFHKCSSVRYEDQYQSFCFLPQALFLQVQLVCRLPIHVRKTPYTYIF